MHADVTALIELQNEDAVIYDLEARLDALRPRLEALDRERDGAVRELDRARQAIAGEEHRLRDLQGRVAQQRQLEGRNQAQLDSVTSLREATAASAQLEQAKRMLAESEREASGTSQRLADLRQAAQEAERTIAEMDSGHQAEREAIEAERQEIEQRLGELRRRRGEMERKVPRSLLGQYDRIRRKKRENSLVALRGQSCGHCDTIIPLQRRNHMAATGAVEICEACGVMLYVPPAGDQGDGQSAG